MNDLTKMTPIAAITWYDRARSIHLDAIVIEQLVGYGITDTAAIVEIAETTALADLHKVPGLAPTLDNLRLLAKVGPDVLSQDPENASDWLGLVDHPQVTGDGFEALAPFIAAGRGPAFARQVLDLFERQDGRYFDATDYNLHQPYAELVDMVENGITELDRAHWASAGFGLADIIALKASGLDLDRIEWLKGRGVPREKWATYVPIPMEWFRTRYSDKDDIKVPEGIDLDLLLTMAAKGWAAKLLDVSGRRGVRYFVRPWQVYAVREVRDLTADQVERLMAAKLTNLTACSYYIESRAGAFADSRKTPPSLIQYPRDVELPQLDDLLDWWIKLAAAGVRPSHLSEYRWSGCTSYQEILDAVAAGITPKRSKELRELHGGKVGRQVVDTKRIATYAALLAHHTGDEENNSAVTRPDEKKVS